MKLMKKDIKPNQKVMTFFALESMQLRKSRNQNHFLLLHLYDKTGRINGYLWDDPIEMAEKLQEKSFVKVRGVTSTPKDSLIITVERIRTAKKEEIDITDFLEMTPGGIIVWHERLLNSVETIQDAHCRKLIDAFLSDTAFLELFTTSPGGISVHHNYVGGLLDHTVSTMELVSLFADRHPALIDRDVLLTGAFLHDAGKTREIYWEIARQYTTKGKLLGHITLGIIMLEEKLRELMDFPPELADRLRHMIVAHHGTLEHGSPVRLSTPEALVLHLLEATDARINHLYRHTGKSDPNSEWSSYDRILETEIYQKKYSRNLQETLAVAA
jgi:3'-5' exoribonuclease